MISQTICLQLLAEKKSLFSLIFKVSNTIFFHIHPAVSFPILFSQKCTQGMCLSAIIRASLSSTKRPFTMHFLFTAETCQAYSPAAKSLSHIPTPQDRTIREMRRHTLRIFRMWNLFLSLL